MTREIRPGDKVEYQSRMCRVIEVYPEKGRLLVHRVAGPHSGTRRIGVDQIAGHEVRPENEVIRTDQ